MVSSILRIKLPALPVPKVSVVRMESSAVRELLVISMPPAFPSALSLTTLSALLLTRLTRSLLMVKLPALPSPVVLTDIVESVASRELVVISTLPASPTAFEPTSLRISPPTKSPFPSRLPVRVISLVEFMVMLPAFPVPRVLVVTKLLSTVRESVVRLISPPLPTALRLTLLVTLLSLRIEIWGASMLILPKTSVSLVTIAPASRDALTELFVKETALVALKLIFPPPPVPDVAVDTSDCSPRFKFGVLMVTLPASPLP